MYRIMTVLLIGLLPVSIRAQWQLRAAVGPGFLSSATRDSLFAAGATGWQGQIGATYFWGHLGMGISINRFGFTGRSNADRNGPPAFASTIDSLRVSGAGLSGTSLLAGPELCFTCSKKIKLLAGFRMGIVWIDNKRLRYQRTNTVPPLLLYSNNMDRRTSFTYNINLVAHYAVNTRYGIGLTAGYQHFKVAVQNLDYRFSLLNPRTLKQSMSLWNIGTSIVYHF
jgi:hypothetical protein